MNEKEKALQHVRSVCPELMELSFGCELEMNPDKDFWTVGSKVRGGHFDAANKYGEHRFTHSSQVVEIIGHTPHLEHWLRGMGENYYVSNNGHVYERVEDNWLLITPTTQKYNLTKDGNNQDESFYKAYNQIVGL